MTSVNTAPDEAPGARFADRAAQNLSALVRIPTVSRADPAGEDSAAFEAFPRELAQRYPLLHEQADLTVVGRGGLLFHLSGSAPTDRAIVLMAHWDVVPVEGQQWSGDPFSGEVDHDAGVVRGRGTLDDKGSLVVICEAVETLLEQDWTPQDDVYLSFGRDEEVLGSTAHAAVEHLHARGVRPWLVLDEGGAVVEGVFPGLARPAAMIGVAEKGVLDLSIAVDADPGHAATPTAGGAVARLARAIDRIDRHPFPAHLSDPSAAMVRSLGEHVAGPLRAVCARVDRVRPMIARVFARLGPETAAVVRTTVALTELSGSPAANVIASRAQARANIRIAVGETVSSTVDRLRRVIGDDAVTLEVVSGDDPSPVSPSNGEQFAELVAAVGCSQPDAVAAPYVMLQASDARHFHRISDHVYRFSPFRMSAQQRESIHGVDEYVDIASLGAGVAFYRHLLGARD